MRTFFGMVALLAGLFLLVRYAIERFVTRTEPPAISAIVGLALSGTGIAVILI